MTPRPTPTHDELHSALIASGVRMDFAEALANPAIARILALYAQARRSPCQPTAVPTQETHWATRLRRLVGDIDHQALRAGDLNRD